MISYASLVSLNFLFALVRAQTLPVHEIGVANEQYTLRVSHPTRSIHLTDPSPIGLSFEFSALPDYVNKVPSTSKCIQNLADALGSKIPVRLGGTTQNDAHYDPHLKNPVEIYNLTPADHGRPKKLTYGPEFIKLARNFSGPVTFGLTRKLNNLDNTILAAKEVVKQIDHLYAIELENEPECEN
ncbi:hypothetical protein CROQUDRAFT_99820 [Cronartium quercuum f. sp. fusiforme G11]|uniref:Glycoside hydrolase family 79 protein n=1 Tax=Cronartium quercuum f. sp. fusiforme G11 TaxID=708437 RepID=A0A9P6NAY0_9BASI|nr:hypothetical protein CROQUDRAFT_99820 [Cronartium quercuum f. sp. fusiforme G11]